MIIVWDEPKRLANLDKHGMDFTSLTVDFFEDATVAPARGNRYVAIGRLSHQTVAVIFIPLGLEALAIISMRPASKSERKMTQ